MCVGINNNLSGINKLLIVFDKSIGLVVLIIKFVVIIII